MTIHDRNLQELATEVNKSINDLSPVIMKDIFDVKSICYTLRSTSILCARNEKYSLYLKEQVYFVHETKKQPGMVLSHYLSEELKYGR